MKDYIDMKRKFDEDGWSAILGLVLLIPIGFFILAIWFSIFNITETVIGFSIGLSTVLGMYLLNKEVEI